MTVTQHNARSARGPRPVERQSPDAELSARFEQDVVPLQQTLYRHAFRLSHNHTDAEDLVQETMVKAYGAFHSFRPDTNLKASLFRILTQAYTTNGPKERRHAALCSPD